jgi:uncharacterized integral membrane protein (TIGR00698 family)
VSPRSSLAEPTAPPSGGHALARVRASVLGLIAVAAVAAVATVVSGVLPGSIGSVSIAVVLGILLAQVLPQPLIGPGVTFATTRILRFGIVLLGARLSLGEVAEVGLPAAGLVAATLVIGAAAAWMAGRVLGVDRTLLVLLGIGSAVCGNTAIMAAAPVLRARHRDVGLAVASITLCGTVLLLLYPLLGRTIGMPDGQFGIWVGLAVQDTSQVIAAGAAYSEDALGVATVVKLIRNASLLLVLPLVAWGWGRCSGDAAERIGLRGSFPTFVLGFIALAALRSAGVISPSLGDRLGDVAGWAVLVAVAGLGLSIPLADVRVGSWRAVGVAAAAAACLGVFAFVAAVTTGVPPA